MKRIIFTLAIICLSLISNAAGIANIWGISSTEVLQGSTQWVDVKYNANFVGTISCSLGHYNTDHTGTQNNIAIFIHTFAELDAMQKNGDGTTRVFFTIPADYPTGDARYKDGFPNTFDIFVSSATPDAYISGYTSNNGIPGNVIDLNVTYTYDYQPSDVLKIYFGSDIVYEGFYAALINFTVPNVASNVYYLGLNDNDPNNVFLHFTVTNTQTNTLLPSEEVKQGIVYYYSNTGVFIKETKCGIAPELTGAYTYKIAYNDKTSRSGHVYFMQ